MILAHLGHGSDGLMSGLLHPITGIDHLLAMLAVGMLAAQIGGRSVWALPAVFIASMAAGGAMAGLGMTLPGVEGAIAVSLVVIGLLVAIGRSHALAAIALVGVFALFHGHAHVAEGSMAGGYVTGFLVATALLHAAGVAMVLGLMRIKLPVLARLAGGTIAAIGLLVLGSPL